LLRRPVPPSWEEEPTHGELMEVIEQGLEDIRGELDSIKRKLRV
jgi:hypothetical protein